MSRRSIRSRLTIRLLVGMIGLCLIANAALYLYMRGELIEQYDGALITEARAIVGTLSSDDDNEHFASLIRRSFPRMRLSSEDEGFLQVWDDEGNLILRSSSLKGHDLPVTEAASHAGMPRVHDITLPDNRAGRATSIIFERELEPSDRQSSKRVYRMTLAARRDELDYTLTHVAISLTLIGGALTAAAVALLIWGVRRELKPLDDFSEQMQRVDANTLAYRFDEVELCQELLPISGRLNGLLARLHTSFNRERRFSSNLAHELRTPIAELRSMIEVALRWPDAAAVPRLHQQILEISERMSRLVAALLSLIRVQQGREQQAREHLVLSALVATAWRPHEAIARERNLSIDFAIDDRNMIVGDRTMLEALISNLLANAAQYATPSTEISCRSAPGGNYLVISNATTDLERADLSKVQEPFWRKDSSRTHGGRLGLGLAIVCDYAAAMKLQVSFSMPTPSRFAAELRWSAVDESSQSTNSATRLCGTPAAVFELPPVAAETMAGLASGASDSP